MNTRTLYEQRMEVFIRQSQSAAFWSPLGTILMAVIQGPIAGWGRAAAWFLIIISVELFIIAVGYRYRSARAAGESGAREASLTLAATFLVGLAWGSSVWFFWTESQIIYYLSNLVILIGVIGVCIVIMSPIRLALALFTGGVLMPPLTHLFFINSPFAVETAAGLVSMLILTLKYGRVAEKQLATALAESQRNEGLAGELAAYSKQLEATKLELNQALAIGNIGSWACDLGAGPVRLSPQACHIYGLPVGTQLEQASFFKPMRDDDDDDDCADLLCNDVFDLEHRIDVGGETRWVRQMGQIEQHPGAAPRVTGITQDITARKQSDEEIRKLAFFDPLTGLPNRRLMVDRLRQALIGSARSGRRGALLLIDMDDFKLLNDTLGHDVGDRFLIEVGRRLQGCVRSGDTVARQGGDEFIVILEELSAGPEASWQAETIARGINIAISEAYALDISSEGIANLRTYHCTSSIGVALFADGAITSEELLKRADTAMYHAKAAGRNTMRFFDNDMQQAVANRARLHHDLHEALGNRQFALHFQPQVDRHGQLVGAEALLRWQHPQRGAVSPAEFIPEAEASGLILPIGRWVLESACAQLAAWQADAGTAALVLAVNVSAQQVRQADFVTQVQAIIERSGARADRLKIELTESLLLDDVEDTIDKMAALKRTGITFSLDDFGTGYSSLSYLKRLPLDQLKIDRAFVRDIMLDADDAAIATAIITLAGTLQLEVIAEGVETAEQRDFLIAGGCRLFQGYYFSKPLPRAEFERYARNPAVRGQTQGSDPSLADSGVRVA